MMYREIFEPKDNLLTIELPQEFIGERVIVEIRKSSELSKEEKLKKLNDSLVGFRVDLSNFKFNRDEANNYE